LIAVIKVENVSLAYGEHLSHRALSAINLNVKKGESWALIGPSGCGKSSLLFLIAGLLFPQKGMVEVLGQAVTRPREDVALILQDYGLFPWKNVRDNIALGLKLRGYAKKYQNEKVNSLLETMGLAEFGSKYPSQLSGGQQQRVAVARALALQPALLLMDEPFSALDALTRESLQEMLLDIWLQQKMTLVFVTHNIEEAVFLGEYIAIFSPRPGTIKKIVANKGMGSKNYRATTEYYRRCSEVRKILEDCSNGST